MATLPLTRVELTDEQREICVAALEAYAARPLPKPPIGTLPSNVSAEEIRERRIRAVACELAASIEAAW